MRISGGDRGRRVVRALVALAVSALAASTLGAATAAQEVRPHAPFWTSPPTRWATPLAGGPVRVAFVVPRDAEFAVVALADRAELRAETALYDPDAPVSADAAVEQALKAKFDAIVLSGVAVSALSEPNRARLRDAVAAGRGVLWVTYGDSPVESLGDALHVSPDPADLTAGLGWDALALAGAPNPVTAYSSASGRAVAIRFPGPRGAGEAFAPCAAIEYPTAHENYLSLLLRAIRWAARRDPPIAIQAIAAKPAPAPDSVDTPPQLPRQFVERMQQSVNPALLRDFVLTLSGPAPRQYQLRFQFRYPGRGVQWSFDAEETVTKGATTVELSLPSGSGEYLLDAWLMDRADVVDWFTAAIALPGRPQISNVQIAPGVIEANGKLSIAVDVHGGSRSLVSAVAGRGNASARATVIARMVDAFGRVGALASRPVPADGGRVGIELPIADWIGSYGRAEIFVTDGFDENASWWLRQTASYAAADVYVRQPRQANLEVIVDAPVDAGPWSRSLRQRLAEAGVQRIATERAESDTLLATDGLRPLVLLPRLKQPPAGESFALSPAADELRLTVTNHAALRPGLYLIDSPIATNGEASSEAENARSVEALRYAMQSVLRESDPAALLGFANDSTFGGVRVVEADDDARAGSGQSRPDYTLVRARMPADDSADAYARWLPWFAAIEAADGVWLTGVDWHAIARDDTATPFAAFATASETVRAGFDVLFRLAQPANTDPEFAESSPGIHGLTLPEGFAGRAGDVRFGAARVVVALRNAVAEKKNEAVRFDAEKTLHLYTPLDNTDVPTRRAFARLAPGQAALFVTLPYEVTRVVVAPPESVDAGQRLDIPATVKTRGVLPGPHLLHVRVFDPNGTPLRLYSRTILARDGHGATYIPLAHNELPGIYRVIVRDVLSGIEGVAQVEVI